MAVLTNSLLFLFSLSFFSFFFADEIVEEYRRHGEGPEPDTKAKRERRLSGVPDKEVFGGHVEGKEESGQLPLPQ